MSRAAWRAMAGLLLLCLGLACTLKEPEWTRPDAAPLALETDRADCRASAEAMARAESFSGRKPLPEVAWRIYLDCMAARGWSAATVDAPPVECPDSPRLNGVGVAPPAGFRLSGRAWQGLGPVSACVYVYENPEGAILRLEAQAAGDGFLPSCSPTEPTLVLVDRGVDVLGDVRLDWAVAAGKRDGVAVAAFTAFVLAGEGKERLAVSLVAPLADDGEPAPLGLRLPHGRREAALELAGAWRDWLALALAGP